MTATVCRSTTIVVEDDTDDESEEEMLRFANESQRLQAFLNVLQGQHAYLQHQVNDTLTNLNAMMEKVNLVYTAKNAANSKSSNACCKRRSEELFGSTSDDSSESTDEIDVDSMGEGETVVYRGLGDHDDDALFGPGGPNDCAPDMNDSAADSPMTEVSLPRSSRVAAVVDELEKCLGGTADEVASALQDATAQLEDLFRGISL